MPFRQRNVSNAANIALQQLAKSLGHGREPQNGVAHSADRSGLTTRTCCAIAPPRAPWRLRAWRRQPCRARTSGCSYRRSTYRSWSSSRDRGGVQRRSNPSRRQARARRRTRSNALRSRTSASSRSVSSALTERPSSAAITRASRRRSASSFKVTFVFTRSLVQHKLTCPEMRRQLLIPRCRHHALRTGLFCDENADGS